MAVLWRKSLRSFFVVSWRQTFSSLSHCRASVKDNLAQDTKMEKIIRKTEERKDLITQIRKGYFADFHEFRRNGGKRSIALGRLFEPKDSLPFPQLTARSLSEKEVCLGQTFPGHVTLVLMWLKAMGERMCDKYRLSFVEHFSQEPLVQYYEINVIDGHFFKVFRSIIKRNLQKEKSLERHDKYLCYSGDTKLLKEKYIENGIVGHAYLVDHKGLVRWRAHAFPTDEELQHMIDCSEMLLRDVKRLAKSSNTRSTNKLQATR